MAVQLVQRLQSEVHGKGKDLLLNACDVSMRSNTYLIIRLPHSRVMRLLARSIVLALLFATLPLIRMVLFTSPLSATASPEPQLTGTSRFNVKFLTFLFRDLSKEGLYKLGNRAVFVSNDNDHDTIYDPQILKENDAEIISISDVGRQAKTPDESYDFAFSYGSDSDVQDFIDRSLKIGGILVMLLSNGTPSFKINPPSNYKIVYVRRLQSTVLAMKKTGNPEISINTKRKLLTDHATEERKAALKNLEDVLLEPPRAASGKSRTYLKKTRYLPDLLGDSLESYTRRVFIDVGLPEKEGGSGTGWFAKHYPTRNLDFEMYKIETVSQESSGKEIRQVEKIEISDWLRKNAREEEYIVMKAEAEVVEEMMKSKAIRLVDELFMECKPSGHGRKLIGSKRAYWECLALYGRLRDEGVAVHQWWG